MFAKHTTTLSIIGFGVLVLCISALLLLLGRGKSHSGDDPVLKKQIELIQGLTRKNEPLFLSPDLIALSKGRIENMATLSPSKEQSEAALGSPTFFGSLHREKRFSAVLLSPAQGTLPLCEFLLASPLWSLKDVSQWGYLFLPVGSGEWSPPSAEEILRNYPDPKERALWLITTAGNLIAIKRTKEAETLVREAAKTNRFPSGLLATQASLAAARGRWNEALVLSRQSLSKNSSNIEARIILTRALIECGKPDESFSEAKKLKSLTLSRNTEVLFLLARAANAANDKNEEIHALRDLVALAQEHHQPLGASLTYLGQAYAQNGERGMAMRTFDEALEAPELTEEQRKMIRELIAHLKPDPSGQPAPSGN
jgi:hypothetical protein